LYCLRAYLVRFLEVLYILSFSGAIVGGLKFWLLSHIASPADCHTPFLVSLHIVASRYCGLEEVIVFDGCLQAKPAFS
jgi:hypothetical protein